MHPAAISGIEAMLSPTSIALIGASESPGSVGRTILENLRAGGFSGALHLVNSRHDHVLGSPAFPSIAAVTGPVDLAVIATPAATVPGIIDECAKAGVRGAVIISAGFREAGAAGIALEREILRRRGAMRIIGPNCLGVMLPHAKLNATFAAGMAHPGSVGFLSQSGALCTAILDWSLRENVGFSAFVSVGAMADVNCGDLIYHLGDDPHTRSIVMYMESIGDARSFLSAAREVALTKPIIVLKVGRTEAASRAAASHTGSLTGSDDVLDAAFRRVGVLRVDTIAELFDMAEVLSKQPQPRGPRLAIVTNAGGPGALATDMLVNSGGSVARFSKGSIAALDRLLPAHWSHQNPIDILGDAGAERYAKAAEIALDDASTDGLLVILTPQAMTDATATAERIGALAKREGKPVLASWMGAGSVRDGETILNRCGIPTFAYPDRAAAAFAAMWRYTDHLRSIYETPSLGPETGQQSEGRSCIGRIVRAARVHSRTLLTEAESKEILAAYGIPVVETRVAKTEARALRHAKELGGRVVLKLLSETVTHKAAAGGVKLNLHGTAEVRRAFREIQAAVPRTDFLGVTVEPMIERGGFELILGSTLDPQFGPTLLFGAGGSLVEVFRDRAIGFPPLNATLARRMMEQTRIFRALAGKGIDTEALTHLLVRFSQLVAEQRWIAESDINPLLVSREGFIALDARFILHDPKTEPPPLAIRPYPAQYITRAKLRDGTRVTLRPIRPEDEPLMLAFHRTLSDRTVHFRYFNQLSLDARTGHERLRRICFNDYDRELALVAERKRGSLSEILGIGRLSRLHGVNEAEFALLVADPWHGRGIGTRLLRELIKVGRCEGLQRIRGRVIAGNAAMLHVCRKAGFELHSDDEGGDFVAELSP